MAALLYAHPGHPSVAADECKHVYRIVPNFQGIEFLRIDHQPRNFEKLQILKNLAPRKFGAILYRCMYT